jgi:hypothetical protein
MLTPITERQKTLIVNNVVKAVKDIHNLNKTGYNFLYLAIGFIAHYNMHGFIAHYTNENLKEDILRNQRANKYLNFNPTDVGYGYYKSKADVYNRIVEAIS